MPKQKKKKGPGRPKKVFKAKPAKRVKSGPGRPRKNVAALVAGVNSSSTFVQTSVHESKRKDLIILLLFLCSFVIFLVSLYLTLGRDTKHDYTNFSPASGNVVTEVPNVVKGNIAYSSGTTSVGTVTHVNVEEKIITDFYQAMNALDVVTLNAMTDSHLKQSNEFITYYSTNRLNKFFSILSSSKVMVSNVQERASTSKNPGVKEFTYTLTYSLLSNQKFIENRSAVLILRGDTYKVGKLMCDTVKCSTLPFFNPDKYK